LGAITPVVNAIRVVERIVPDGQLLFGHQAHDLHTSRPATGSLQFSGQREPYRSRFERQANVKLPS
jgi:hypothetical protein